MKYFIDTEFIEKPGSIQLVSVGIAAEDVFRTLPVMLFTMDLSR